MINNLRRDNPRFTWGSMLSTALVVPQQAAAHYTPCGPLGLALQAHGCTTHSRHEPPRGGRSLRLCISPMRPGGAITF